MTERVRRYVVLKRSKRLGIYDLDDGSLLYMPPASFALRSRAGLKVLAARLEAAGGRDEELIARFGRKHGPRTAAGNTGESGPR